MTIHISLILPPIHTLDFLTWSLTCLSTIDTRLVITGPCPTLLVPVTRPDLLSSFRYLALSIRAAAFPALVLSSASGLQSSPSHWQENVHRDSSAACGRKVTWVGSAHYGSCTTIVLKKTCTTNLGIQTDCNPLPQMESSMFLRCRRQWVGPWITVLSLATVFCWNWCRSLSQRTRIINNIYTNSFTLLGTESIFQHDDWRQCSEKYSFNERQSWPGRP